MKTILAPIDFSDVTPKVIQATLDLARDLQAQIFLLHVVPPPVFLTGYGFGGNNVPDQILREQKEAKQRLQTYKTQFESEGLTVKVSTVQGPPVESILLVAYEQEADLVVIGSHGHGAFYEFIVGSTTRGVLRRFPGPVVIVPSRVAEEEQRAAS